MSEEKKSTYTGYTPARGKSAVEYAKRSLKRIPLDVQKEKYEEIKAAADALGETVNGYIKKAINSYPDSLNSIIITLFLDEDISFNDKIFDKLEPLLLENSQFMTGFIRSGSSDGEYKLSLRFKDKNEQAAKITQRFCDILTSEGISFNYSTVSVASDTEN